MNIDYSDIIRRAGAPIWWDEHGAPRYQPFAVAFISPYARAVALLTIRCCACGQRFDVARPRSVVTPARPLQLPAPNAGGIGSFSYGDPPHHGCHGDGQAAITEAVLEVWQRDELGPTWRRMNDSEGTIEGAA